MSGIFDWYRKPVEEREADVAEARKQKIKNWSDMFMDEYKAHGHNRRLCYGSDD
jgi:hypothetical protein